MNKHRLTELMHAVLDNEATVAERQELERLLADDPVAQAEFRELKRLFEGLALIPKAYPPEGLVAYVMANVNIPQNSPSRGRFDQLFGWSSIIGLTARETRAKSLGYEQRPLLKGANMSEKIGGSKSKRKVLIGAIAVAAAAVTASFVFDVPPGVDSIGTIVPALRYRADQPTAGDVKLGGAQS